MNICTNCKKEFLAADRAVVFTQVTIDDNLEDYTSDEDLEIFCLDCYDRIVFMPIAFPKKGFMDFLKKKLKILQELVTG